MVWSFPIMLLSLVASMAFLLIWYRKEIHELSELMEQRRGNALPLGPTVRVPYMKGLLLLGGTIGLVALHHRIELLLDLQTIKPATIDRPAFSLVDLINTLLLLI